MAEVCWLQSVASPLWVSEWQLVLSSMRLDDGRRLP